MKNTKKGEKSMTSIVKKLVIGFAMFTLGMMVLNEYAQAVPQVPQLINYQAVIKNQSNSQTVPDGQYQITYRIYTTLTGGASVWSETASNDTVASGVLNHVLGSVSSLTTLPENVNYYLTIQLNGDSEMSPREPLQSVGSALIAGGLSNGATWVGTVTGTNTTGSNTLNLTNPNGTGYTSGVYANGGNGTGVYALGYYDGLYAITNGTDPNSSYALEVNAPGGGRAINVDNGPSYFFNNVGNVIYAMTSDTTSDDTTIAAVYGEDTVFGGTAIGALGSKLGYDQLYGNNYPTGVYGYAPTGWAVYGDGRASGIGVYGFSDGAGYGVWGVSTSPNSVSVVGTGKNGATGVSATSDIGYAISASAGGTVPAIFGTNVVGNAAVEGVGINTTGGFLDGSLGVLGVASGAFFTVGVEGDSYVIGAGVVGNNYGAGYGVEGEGYAGDGVYGISTENSSSYAGVWGENDSGGVGVYGNSVDGGGGIGVYAVGGYDGIYAQTTTSNGWAIEVDNAFGGTAINVDSGASYFQDVYINGHVHTSVGIAGDMVGIMLNSGTDTLELGDVVVIKGNSPAVLERFR
jgi:hypothetical protein